MKPQSIKMFDYLFLGSLALGILNFLLSWGDMEAQMAADPATAQMGTGFLIGIFAFSMLVSLLLWYLISSRGSKIAKWILIIFTVIGLLMLPASLGTLAPLAMVLTLVITAMQLAALFFLFKPDAKAYLAGERSDPDAFD